MNPDQRLQTICLLLLTTFAVATALYWLSSVMIPFVLALFITFAVRPLVDILTRRAKVPRPLAVAGVFLLGVLAFVFVVSVVSASVSQLASNASTYQSNIATLVSDTMERVPLERFGVRENALEKQLSSIPVGSTLLRLTNALLGILSNAILVLIFVVFLLIGGGSVSQSAGPMWGEIQVRIERFIMTKAVLSAATGTLVGLALYFLGVDLALMFGFLAFLLNFIPSIGSIIATLLPLPIILVSPEASLTTALLALLIPGGVQITIGNFVEPKIMGESLDLHPVAILICLIFWGVLWGIVGMLLATPITAVLKIMLERHDLTRPVARLMAGHLGTSSP